MTVHAHFDGRVIVPDQPLDLPPNQALVIRIEAAEFPAETAGETALAWVARNATDNPALPSDLADQHDRYLYGESAKASQD